MNSFTTLSYIVSHIFLILYIYLFIVHRYSRLITGLLCLGLFSALSILDLFKLLFFPDSPLCYVLVTVLQIIATQSTAFFTARKKSGQSLFVALSASSYVIAGAVSSAILKICTGSSLAGILGGAAVHLGILLLLSLTVRNSCLKFQEKPVQKGLWELCLIPVFFYCSFSFIAFFPHTLYDNPDNIPGIVFILITMFISYIVVLRYLESESKRSAIYWENRLQNSYIQGLESRHYLVEQAEQNLKILHHDLRHYSRIIDSLLEQKNYEKIREVNEHIRHMASENKVEEYCGNLVVNTILSSMMAKALSLDIKVDLDARIPKEIPVNDYELTLVIANLFENALQCVKTLEQEKRHIEIKIHCLDHRLFIQTKNQYRDEILLDPDTKLPRSRKKGDHGLGMQNVRSFSEKIKGTVGCDTENGIFRITMYAKL